MSRGGRFLYVAAGRRLLRLDDGATIDVGGVTEAPENVAAVVADALNAASGRDRSLVWALSSQECLAAAWTDADTPKAGDRQSIKFELENHLPFAAEDLTADFSLHDRTVFAVAAATADLSPLVDAFEKIGIQVSSITPLALLWAQAYCASLPDRERPAVVAVELDDRWEWLRFAGGRCTEWLSFDDPALLLHRRERELETEAGSDSATLLASDVDDVRIASSVDSRTSVQPLSDPLETVATSTVDLLNGRIRPWIELRRDQLAMHDPYYAVRGALTGLVVAVAVAAFVVIGVLQWRITMCRGHIADADQRQTALFRELFPNKPPPAGIRSRLRGEADRLSGLSRGVENGAAISAYATLHRLLAALPENARFRITDMRLDEGRLSMDVAAASHSDVSTVSDALTRQGFEVEPARSEQVSSNEVAVRMSARLVVAPSEMQR